MKRMFPKKKDFNVESLDEARYQSLFLRLSWKKLDKQTNLETMDINTQLCLDLPNFKKHTEPPFTITI